MNPSDRPTDMTGTVIMKFGGTSVATEQGRANIVARISAELEKGIRPVVVVSAMGRKGDPYATDTLLSLVDKDHCGAHETDMLMGVGEVISSVVLATLLNKAGIKARAMTGMDAGILTDGVDGNATIKLIDPAAIKKLLLEDTVPVVAGFQGADKDGLLKTLGRGGSDTTACALGAALGAERVDIYTDVDGVFTADPRIIEDARVLERITADELFQMAKHGSKVVHPSAAELALGSGMSMRVRSTFNDFEGTEVVSLDVFRPDALATAVTIIPDVSRLCVKLPSDIEEPRIHMETQMKVYRLMADASISIDMFTPLNDNLVFTVPADKAQRALEIVRAEGLIASLRTRLGKVTLVGSGMQGIPGVMARVATCLWDEGIDILQVADSHATISLLLNEDELVPAAKALHRAFEL